MDHLISIIVPIYNAESYLCCCIDSILSQTFTDFELILVNDGSTDESNLICDQYALEDKRVRVFHKSNTGVSDTRNYALDNANGRYVMFMDADDFWCTKTVLERFFYMAESNNLDIVRGEYKAVDESGNLIFMRSIPEEYIKYSNRILGPYDFLRYAIKGEYFLPLCLFRKSTINEFRFEKGRIFLEDMQFFSSIMLQHLKCMYLPDVRFYAYRKYGKSVSSKVDNRKIKDSFDMCYFFHNLSIKADDIKIKQYFNEQSIYIYYSTLETLSIDGYYAERNEYINSLNLYKLQKDIYSWIKEYRIIVNNLIYKIPPNYGIYYFRLRYYISSFKRKILKFKVIKIKNIFLV